LCQWAGSLITLAFNCTESFQSGTIILENMKKFGDTAQGGEKPMGCGMVTNRNNNMMNKMNQIPENIL